MGLDIYLYRRNKKRKRITIKEAKEYIDSVKSHSSMSVMNENFYDSYSIYNEWIVVDRNTKEIVN